MLITTPTVSTCHWQMVDLNTLLQSTNQLEAAIERFNTFIDEWYDAEDAMATGNFSHPSLGLATAKVPRPVVFMSTALSPVVRPHSPKGRRWCQCFDSSTPPCLKVRGCPPLKRGMKVSWFDSTSKDFFEFTERSPIPLSAAEVLTRAIIHTFMQAAIVAAASSTIDIALPSRRCTLPLDTPLTNMRSRSSPLRWNRCAAVTPHLSLRSYFFFCFFIFVSQGRGVVGGVSARTRFERNVWRSYRQVARVPY